MVSWLSFPNHGGLQTMATKKTKLSLAELQAQLAEYGMTVAPDEANLKKKAQEMRARWEQEAKEAGMSAGFVWFSNGNGPGGSAKKIRYRWGSGTDKEQWTGIGEPPKALKAIMGISRSDWLNLTKEDQKAKLAPYKA